MRSVVASTASQCHHTAPSRPQGPPVGLRVGIVGGGVAGLAAARSLLDAGAQVHLYERRSLEEMLAGPAGLIMQPNAMAALRMLSGAGESSLAHDMAAAGIRDPVAVLVNKAGKELTRVSMEDIYNLTRPAMQQALYAALPQGTVTCGAAFHSFSLLPDGRVEVHFGSGDKGDMDSGDGAPAGTSGGSSGEQGSSHVFDVLVGADGIRSAVRARLDELMSTPPRQPVYSGYRYYRGLVDLEKLGGAEAWKQSLGGDVNRFFYADNGTCIAYQVSPTHASFARYTPAPVGASRGIPPQQAKQELEELCSDYGSPAADMAAALDAESIHVGELWHMAPNKEVWGAGCVTLVGDAAHGLLPTLGQGAGQGIEDAVELAVALHRATVAKAASSTAASPTSLATDGNATNGAPQPGPNPTTVPASVPANGLPVSAQLTPAEVVACLRGFEAARGPRTARIHAFSVSAFKSGAGETALARLKRNLQFSIMPVWVIKYATAWLTEQKFSWDD